MSTSMAQRIFLIVAALAVTATQLTAQQLAATSGFAVTGAGGSAEVIYPGTIKGPVTTGFATFRPSALPKYKIAVGLSEPAPRTDLSNVALLSSIGLASFFTEGERSLLVSNGFVARPEPLGNFGAAYAYEASSHPLGSFVTIDAVAHGLRVTVDQALRELESGFATDLLSSQFNVLAGSIQRQLDNGPPPQVSRSLTTLLGYMQTGERLLNRSSKLDARIALEVMSEVEKINAASGTAPSSVLRERDIDYSIFRPGDDAAADERLASFFKARQWASQITFVVRDESGRYSPEQIREALILARVISDLSSSTSFHDDHQRLLEPVAYLTGGLDDGVPWEAIASSVRNYYGVLATTGNDYLLSDDELAGLGAYIARSMPGGKAVQFRLFAWSDARTPGNALATAMPAGGEPGAYRVLFGLPASATAPSWATSFANTFRYAMQPLALETNDREGLPRFMRSDAWRDRSLASAIGGMSDAALPVESITMKRLPKAAAHNESRELDVDGYVEPRPVVWSRLASLAAYLREGLSRRPSTVSKETLARLKDIEAASSRMVQIAAKELEGRELDGDDRGVIASMRARIVAYESPIDVDAKSARFPGVRQTATRGGNSYPMAIYVIVPRTDGTPGLMLTRGAIYTYVADVDPQGSPGRESRPLTWTGSFVSDDRSFAFDRTKFVGVMAPLPSPLVKNETTEAGSDLSTSSVILTLESSYVSHRPGELWFSISVPSGDRRELSVILVDQGGREVRRMDLGRLTEANHLDLFDVADLHAGSYTIQVEDPTGGALAAGVFSVGE